MYSKIVNRIDSYNNIEHMKEEFIDSIKNCEDFELNDYIREINKAMEDHKGECIEDDDNCTWTSRYNYGISVINKIIKGRKKNISKLLDININNNINSNNKKVKYIKEDNIFQKYWWGLVIPIIVGIVIWYFTK